MPTIVYNRATVLTSLVDICCRMAGEPGFKDGERNLDALATMEGQGRRHQY
jgi:hypothetical protein